MMGSNNRRRRAARRLAGRRYQATLASRLPDQIRDVVASQDMRAMPVGFMKGAGAVLVVWPALDCRVGAGHGRLEYSSEEAVAGSSGQHPRLLPWRSFFPRNVHNCQV